MKLRFSMLLGAETAAGAAARGQVGQVAGELARIPAGGGDRVGVVRLLFIDNIRWVMILFVLSMHAAVTYSNVGSWYYNEPATLGQGAKMGFVTYQFFLQSFFMGFLFFIA